MQSLYEEEEEIDEELLVTLEEIHSNPINLNTATDRDLRQLPFLSEKQISEILIYVQKNYPVLSLGELLLIKFLDYNTRQRLRLFVTAGTPSLQSFVQLSDALDSVYATDTLRRRPASYYRIPQGTVLQQIIRLSRNEAVLRTDIPFYKKAGYADVPEEVLATSPNKVYQGDNMLRSLRYRFKAPLPDHKTGFITPHSDNLQAGLQIEKDAGEHDFDYVSGYVLLYNYGRIRNLIVGDYKISLGRGLIMNNGISFGKQTMLNSTTLINRGISKHSSMSEANYLRGIASTLRLNDKIDLTAFVSLRNIDGTLSPTSQSGETAGNSQKLSISSIKTDGLHRTQLERSKRGNTQEATIGGSLQYFHNDLSIALSGVSTNLSRPLRPKSNTASSRYRLYNLQGSTFSAASLSYGMRHDRWTLLGETAMGINGKAMFDAAGGDEKKDYRRIGFATIHSARYEFNGRSFLLSHRYYQPKYATRYGHALSENSNPQNEHAVCLAANYPLSTRLSTETYLDFAHFPFNTTQATQTSNCIDALAILIYDASRISQFTVRYKIKSKQIDVQSVDGSPSLCFSTRQTLRIQHNYTPNPSFSFRTAFSSTFRHTPTAGTKTGWMLGENMKWSPESSRLRANIMLAYFNTDNYDARVYSYEPTLLYSYGMTTLFYHGFRMVTTASMALARHMSLQLKLAHLHYFDRKTIGTGLEHLQSRHKTDLMLQLRSTW